MRLDADQLEWIVREVVRRLRLDSPLPPGEGRDEGAPDSTPHPPAAHITLTQTLITTATIERQLAGVARISIPPKAVVTPAARDLLRERGIELTTT